MSATKRVRFLFQKSEKMAFQCIFEKFTLLRNYEYHKIQNEKHEFTREMRHLQ